MKIKVYVYVNNKFEERLDKYLSSILKENERLIFLNPSVPFEQQPSDGMLIVDASLIPEEDKKKRKMLRKKYKKVDYFDFEDYDDDLEKDLLFEVSLYRKITKYNTINHYVCGVVEAIVLFSLLTLNGFTIDIIWTLFAVYVLMSILFFIGWKAYFYMSQKK